MGFPWKQFAKIGLNVAGATVGGPLPALVRESQKHLAQPDDDDKGHDYVALGIRQIIGASFPKALLPLDNIALSWASIAAQDHKEEEEEDNMEDDAGSSIDIIKHFEGWRDKPYLCPAGEWTIGFGRNFEAAPFTNVEKQELRLLDGGDYSYRPEQEKRSTKGTNLIDLAGRDWDRNPLSKDEGNYLLKGFYETCAEQADVLLRGASSRLRQEAKDIVARMIYQMGYSGVGKFRNMLKALKEGSPDYLTAGHEMRDSKWYAQTRSRAESEAKLMEGLA